MTIDIENNIIYHFDKDLNIKKHKPISTSFKEIEILENGKILIIENHKDFEDENITNLYCLNQKIEIEWHIPYPHNNDDRYVGFTTNGDIVFASSFNGFRVEIDVISGEIKDIKFTK